MGGCITRYLVLGGVGALIKIQVHRAFLAAPQFMVAQIKRKIDIATTECLTVEPDDPCKIITGKEGCQLNLRIGIAKTKALSRCRLGVARLWWTTSRRGRRSHGASKMGVRRASAATRTWPGKVLIGSRP